MRSLQHPVPAKLLIHIGDTTVSFALLESQLQSLFGSLIKEHQRVGQIISTYLNFANLRASILALYRERHGEDEDFSKLRTLMAEAGKVEEERNRITHSIWAAGDTPDSITRLKFTARESRGFHADFEHYDEARLAAFASQIRELTCKIQDHQIELLSQGKVINNPLAKIW